MHRWIPPQADYLLTWTRSVATRRHHANDEGSNTLETIVIAALLFAAAIAVATVIVGKINEYIGKLG